MVSLKKALLTSSNVQQQLSVNVLAALEAHPAFRAANTILLYYSLKDEVFTHEFIKKWSNQKRILLPVVVGNDLELRLYTAPYNMKSGAYGIEEPMGKSFTRFNEIDLAIIPGMAFDKKGNRLGRGKGYYDRLLPHIPTALKIGLCFPFQIMKEVPTESFDIRMDLIITANENELSYSYNPLPTCNRK